MTRRFYLASVLAAASALPVLAADGANPLSAEVKRSYLSIRNNLIKMAEKMPEEQYSFRPTPEVETFGRRVAHITDANMRTCSGLKGEQKSLRASAKTAKADLVAALKQALEYCDSVFDSMTDRAAVELIDASIASPPVRDVKQSRLAVLYSVVRHSNEVYGYMAVYLRLKGIVPPTSEPER